MSTSTLDHIIHLSPPGKLQGAIEHFEKLGFIVLPGGQHADGLTSNALVAFPDGVYLELIAFTQPVEHYPEGTTERLRRENHWWAAKTPGWIDWANLGRDRDVADTINRRAGGLVQYLQPLDGGRKKPDGTELKWRVTFPALTHGRGSVPFFCEDMTPRHRRVPLEPPSNAQHPCGATGVAHVKLLASTEQVERLSKQLSLVLAGQPERVTASELHWTLQTPEPTVSSQGTKLILAPSDAVPFDAGVKVAEIGFHVAAEFVDSASRSSPGGEGAFGAVCWCPRLPWNPEVE